jgi:hypothetical protein
VTRCGFGVSPRAARGPQRGRARASDAALAVRARDERAAHGELRVAERAQQRRVRPSPSRIAVPAALLERAQRVGVVRGTASVAWPSLAGQLVLVEDALVEARGQAHVVDVALLEVDPAAQLAARDVRVLADQRLEQVRRLDRDRPRDPVM